MVGLRLMDFLTRFNRLLACGHMIGARTPHEADTGRKQRHCHDRPTFMANEARLPAPFEEAVEFVMSFLEHDPIMKGQCSSLNTERVTIPLPQFGILSVPVSPGHKKPEHAPTAPFRALRWQQNRHKSACRILCDEIVTRLSLAGLHSCRHNPVTQT